jgi:hypothetical protein
MAHGDTTEPAEDPALCAPYQAINAAFAGEPDPAAVEELLVEAESVVPEEMADTLGVMTEAVRTIFETGDFAVFETPEVTEAKSAMDLWVFESCSFDTKLEVAASEYAFGGLPEELPAGSVATTARRSTRSWCSASSRRPRSRGTRSSRFPRTR